jgi:hypothetical protein
VSQILGNALAGFVLSNYSQLTFFMIMALLTGIAMIYLYKLRYNDDPEPITPDTPKT